MSRQARFLALSLFTSLSCVVASCDRSDAAKTAAPAAELELDAIGVTVFTDELLLYLEHQPVVVGQRTRFLAHLTVLATGEPIRTGHAALVVDTPGRPVELVATAPTRDGLFIPQGAFDAAGRFAARLVVDSEAARGAIDVGELTVHPNTDAARQAAPHTHEPSNAVPFLLEQQWKIQLRLAQAAPRSLLERLSVPAEIVTPPGAEAVVSAPTAGRLLAPETGTLPRIGDRVQPGQVVGFVEPPLAASDLAQLRALDLQHQTLDLEIDLKSLEVARAIHETEMRLAFAEKEATRVANLRAEGLSTVQEHDRAQQLLAVARLDQQATRDTRASLDRLLASRAGRTPDDGPKSVRLPLVAPIGGVVVAQARVVGESAQPGDAIFRLLDTTTVWVEGRISEFDVARVPSAPGATFSVPGLGDRAFDLLSVGGRMQHIAPIVDAATRTLVIRYEIPNPQGALKAGMLATLMLETGQASDVLAIPEEAVLLEHGLPTAYVMLEGELFQKRELELGLRDGGYVEVRSGLRAGERVATHGNYIVKLAALSPTSFGPGHAH